MPSVTIQATHFYKPTCICEAPSDPIATNYDQQRTNQQERQGFAGLILIREQC